LRFVFTFPSGIHQRKDGSRHTKFVFGRLRHQAVLELKARKSNTEQVGLEFRSKQVKADAYFPQGVYFA
jgi:hypothetical protein